MRYFTNNLQCANILSNAQGMITLYSNIDYNPGKKGITVKDRRTKAPFANVFGGSVVTVIKKEFVWCGQDYEEQVNRRRQQEGNQSGFKAQEHKWATHMVGTQNIKLNPKNGVLYFTYFIDINPNHKYSHKEYVDANGTPLSADQKEALFEGFFPTRDIVPVQEHQGTEKIVDPRQVTISNIKAFRHGGKSWKRKVS